MNLLRLAMLFACVQPASAGAAIDPDPEKEMSIESFLQTLSTVPGTVQRRDPFTQVPPPFGEADTTVLVETPTGPEVNPSLNPLERFPLESYEVVAVLLSDQPRALVRVPVLSDNERVQKVLIVKQHDTLGDKKGIVTKMSKEGITVQQASRVKGKAVDKWDTLLKVGATAEQQRRTAEEKALKDQKAQHDSRRSRVLIEN